MAGELPKGYSPEAVEAAWYVADLDLDLDLDLDCRVRASRIAQRARNAHSRPIVCQVRMVGGVWVLQAG